MYKNAIFIGILMTSVLAIENYMTVLIILCMWSFVRTLFSG